MIFNIEQGIRFDFLKAKFKSDHDLIINPLTNLISETVTLNFDPNLQKLPSHIALCIAEMATNYGNCSNFADFNYNAFCPLKIKTLSTKFKTRSYQLCIR